MNEDLEMLVNLSGKFGLFDFGMNEGLYFEIDQLFVSSNIYHVHDDDGKSSSQSKG